MSTAPASNDRLTGKAANANAFGPVIALCPYCGGTGLIALTEPEPGEKPELGYCPECVSGPQERHNRQVAEMYRTGLDDAGLYTDPVTGRKFPSGRRIKMNPNRAERRRLARWRRTGRVK